MLSHRHPLLLIVMLLAIGLRSTLGAPCCMDPLNAANGHHSASATDGRAHDHAAHHEARASGDQGHEEHSSDSSANPCCSACGPTLPSEPVELTAQLAPRMVIEPLLIRALATRPPFPAYDATGPPELV